MNLRQLADHLQLSQTTVSRALNGYPEVSEDTRQRVMRAARELNYSPNSRAKGLATGRSMAVGHVIPVSDRHQMVNPIFGDFIAGAGEVYAAAGYDMVLSLVQADGEEDLYRSIRARGNVDGMVVNGPRIADPRIALLNDLGLPFVVHGRASRIDEPYAWVDSNSERAFERATTHLIDLGHRRIALINGHEDMDFAHRRRLGCETALAARGLSPDPDLMCAGEMTELFGHQCALRLLRSENPPTAVLVSSLIAAIGVRRAVQDLGLTPGRDVSIVTHDDDLSYMKNGADVPIFTATRASVREAGRHTARMLLSMIAAPQAPRPTRLMEAEFILGASTGPAPT